MVNLGANDKVPLYVEGHRFELWKQPLCMAHGKPISANNLVAFCTWDALEKLLNNGTLSEEN